MCVSVRERIIKRGHEFEREWRRNMRIGRVRRRNEHNVNTVLMYEIIKYMYMCVYVDIKE